VTPLRPVLMVLGAAACWGSLGIAYRLILGATSLAPVTLVTVRASGAALLLLAWCLVARRDALRVARRDLPFLVAFGLLTVTGFYITLILAIAWSGVAVATVLLYLAPALVTLGAAVFYGERLTRPRLLALTGAVAGAALVAEVYQPAALIASGPGLLMGLLSAAGYALYSLLGKRAMARHPAATVLLYNLGVGALGLLAVTLALGPGPLPDLPTLALIALGTGTLLTLAPITLYLLALRELPAGVASIIATAEPVIAILLAWLVLGEALRPLQAAGAALVLGSVLIIVLSDRR
jgi:DME family drug/metabolite transporter